MNVRKVAAGSVLAAGLGVAGLLGSATAFADVTNNPTTNDATGYGTANYNNLVHNVTGGDNLGSTRAGNGGAISQSVGVNTPKYITVDTQGNPPGYPPISNKDGNKFAPTTLAH